MMMRHPSVLASAAAGGVLAATSTVTTLPWWVWAAWAGLTAVAIAQAVRSARA